MQAISFSGASMRPTRAAANIAATEEKLNQRDGKILDVDRGVAVSASCTRSSASFRATG